MADDRPVFEIPLTGPDGRPRGTGHGESDPERGDRGGRPTRGTVATAVSGVVIVAALVATVVSSVTLTNDESTTDEMAGTTTVLPMLPRLEDLDGLTTTTTGTTNKDLDPPRSTLSGEPIVELPSLRHTGGFSVGSFVLSERSVDELDDEVARRSTTDHVVGADGFRQRVTVTNDPTTDRYRIDVVLRLDGRTSTGSIVIDLVEDIAWLPTGSGGWTPAPGDDVARRAGHTSMADFVRRLQLGPLRSDTRPAWSNVRSSGLVEYPGEDGPLAEWVVTVDAGDVPVWSRYALGPLAEAAPLPASTPVEFRAYVGSTGELRRVTAETEFGATSERIDHRVVVLAEPVTLDVPDTADGSTDTSAPDTADDL